MSADLPINMPASGNVMYLFYDYDSGDDRRFSERKKADEYADSYNETSFGATGLFVVMHVKDYDRLVELAELGATLQAVKTTPIPPTVTWEEQP